MPYSGPIPILNKIIVIKNDIITIRYNNKQQHYNFFEVHDIGLTKMKVKKNVILLNVIALFLTSFPIVLYHKMNSIIYINFYVILLLLFLHFKSNRYEQAYYLKVTLNNGHRERIKIYSKDRLDVIREITSYIDYRFKRSMQELFTDLHQSKPSALIINVS